MLPIPISKSATPLVFDALPALKVRHYVGTPTGGNIYTLARFYLLGEALALSLCVFEKTPPPESRVGFAIAGTKGRVLVLALGPKQVRLQLAPDEEAPPPPKAAYFTGQDEQGWYWGANLTLPAEALAKAGAAPAQPTVFAANVAKYRTDETAFGTVFPAPLAAGPFQPAYFGAFQAVEY